MTNIEHILRYHGDGRRLLGIHRGLGPKVHYTALKCETGRISTEERQKYCMKEIWYNRMCTSCRASCLGSRLSNLHLALSRSIHTSSAEKCFCGVNLHFALSKSIYASIANRCFRGVQVATSTDAYSAISSPVLEMRKILGSAKGCTVTEAPCC